MQWSAGGGRGRPGAAGGGWVRPGPGGRIQGSRSWLFYELDWAQLLPRHARPATPRHAPPRPAGPFGATCQVEMEGCRWFDLLSALGVGFPLFGGFCREGKGGGGGRSSKIDQSAASRPGFRIQDAVRSQESSRMAPNHPSLALLAGWLDTRHNQSGGTGGHVRGRPDIT